MRTLKPGPRSYAISVVLNLAAALLAIPASAEPNEVATAIVFAVDASISVDNETADFQRDGHVRALTSPEMLIAIRASRPACIAVSYFEWSNHHSARMILPWTRLCNPDDAADASLVIEAKGDRGKERNSKAMTSISSAIDFAVSLLGQISGETVTKVIDISSNGTNNDGPKLAISRERALSLGYTINAITIPSIEETDLDRYFADNVIGGPGSFVVNPASVHSYADALLRKIVWEISSR